MSPVVWPPEDETSPHLQTWDGDSAALVMWAKWKIESLHYLSDLDKAVGLPPPLRAHPGHVVDLAHATWAASAAVGALDLCSAALARHLTIGPKVRRNGSIHEFDLRQLNAEVNVGVVTGGAATWASGAANDTNVQLLTAIRHPTTHARLRRHFDMGGGRSARTHLVVHELRGEPVEVGDLVEIAMRTSERWVRSFLASRIEGVL